MDFLRTHYLTTQPQFVENFLNNKRRIIMAEGWNKENLWQELVLELKVVKWLSVSGSRMAASSNRYLATLR